VPTLRMLAVIANVSYPAAMLEMRDVQAMAESNITIEYRWAEGRSERYAEIAAEFIRLNVDVIVTVGAPALAAKQMTSVIPIVFAVASDPLGSGLVGSLARPGGNITGLSVQFTDTIGKRLELLRARRAIADDVRLSGAGRTGRPDVLWGKLPEPVRALGRLC
jgi:putative tryptophan/tyrosine transport system substrate-binding protein